MAFADASWYVADPAITAVPVPELLSRSYLAARAQEGFDPERASASPEPGKTGPMAEVQQQRSDTVYFAVTDEDGNGCSFINSNYGGFGSAIVPAGCGFTLHNRGAGFNLQPTDHPNVLAPSKRPYHTIIPAMLTTMAVSELRSKPQIAPTAEAKTDPLKPPHPAEISDRSQGRLELHSVFGVMGGYMQPQGHVQVMLNMLVFGLTPQAALDAPRFCIGAGMPNQGRVLSDTVYLEEGISEVVARQLQEMGHPVRFVRGYERGLFGRGQLIRVHRDEGRLVYSAGSDPRGDGAALAL